MELKLSLFLLQSYSSFPAELVEEKSPSFSFFFMLSIRIGLLSGGPKNTHGGLAFPLSPSGHRRLWRAVCVCVCVCVYMQAIISVSEGKVVLLDGVGSTIREWWS